MHWYYGCLDLYRQTPRSGEINIDKQAIKEAIIEEDKSFNEGLLNDLLENDSSSSWRLWQKRYCSRNITPTNVLNGKYGDGNILSEFTHL